MAFPYYGPRAIVCNVVRSYPTIVPETIKGLGMYPIRELSSSQEGDLIWLPEAFVDMETTVFAHFNAAGIYPTRNILYANDWRTIDPARLQGYSLSPFIMNYEMLAFSREQRWYDAVMAFEPKTRFARFCLKNDIPIATTYFPEDVENLSEEDYARGLFGKLAYTASGIGMKRLWSRANFDQWRTDHSDAGQFVLQEPFPIAAEFGVQLCLEGNQPRIVAITGQHIGGNNDHEGNFVNKAWFADLKVDLFRLTEDALKFGRALMEAGMRHRCGLDGLIDANGRYVFGECNARRTGATFAIDAATWVKAEQWSYRNVLTTARSIEDLDLAGSNSLFYRPGDQSGIIVINAGPIAFGKVSVMMVGDPHEWPRLEREYRSWLGCDVAEAEYAQEQKAA